MNILIVLLLCVVVALLTIVLVKVNDVKKKQVEPISVDLSSDELLKRQKSIELHLQEMMELMQILMNRSDQSPDKAKNNEIPIAFYKSQKISSENLASPDLSQIENKDHMFYGVKVVITGSFVSYPDRNKLAELLKSFGADIQSAISSKTDYVIVGADAGPSKLQKIDEINAVGKKKIIKLDEQMLISFLKAEDAVSK